MTRARTKTEAQQNREDFVERVNAEFGGVEDWEAINNIALQQTGGDNICIQKDILATRLTQEGYLITPHVGRTRFAVKLQPKDVGLDPQDPEHKEFIENYLILGSKLLLPAETLRKLDRIDKQIRRAVEEEYGIPTCMGSFVPYKNLEPMKKKMEELKTEYFAVRDSLIENYETIRFNTKLSYEKFAPEVLRLIIKDSYYTLTNEEVEQFVNSAMKYFPTKQEIHSSFYVKIDVGIVMATAFLAEQETRLRLAREREAIYREELELLDRRLTEFGRVQEEREKQKILVEQEKAKTKIMEEQAKQKAIEEAIAQARDEYLPQMEQVFADLAGSVHGMVYDALTKVTEALKTNGFLRPSDTKSLSNLAEKIRTLVFTPDPDVQRWLLKIDSIVDTPAKRRSMDDVQESLSGIREQAGKVILSLGRAPRTLRGADLPDIEAALEEMAVGVRQKRQLEMKLPIAEEQPLVRSMRTAVPA